MSAGPKNPHPRRRRRGLRVVLIVLGSVVGAVAVAFAAFVTWNGIARANQNAALADGIDVDEPPPAKPAPAADAVTSGATTRGGFTVSGPVAAGSRPNAFAAYLGDIREVGYTEEEFFLSGVAQRYVPRGELAGDGKWTLDPGTTAPYETRMLVRRPLDPAAFNGTVIVEWANVSAGYDFSGGDPEGIYREGFAYVLVSAQPISITGFADNPQGLATWDPERYGDLGIPDEGLSYDVFTQAARAVGPNRAGEGVDPLGGLDVEHVIAYGASQSGSRILAYANGVQPLEQTFDALMPVLDAGHASDFQEADAHGVKGGGSRDVSSKVRDDLQVPVLTLSTQSEAAFMFDMRQPDSSVFRSWEIAGAPHFSSDMMVTVGGKAQRDGIASSLGDLANRPADVGWYPALEAAYVQVDRWIRGRSVSPRFPPLQISLLRFTYDNDEFGNAKGGLRLPEITVPTATYDVSIFGGLLGKTAPFDRERLAKLYPTHADYVAKATAAAERAERDGILLPFRVRQYIDRAEAADIP